MVFIIELSDFVIEKTIGGYRIKRIDPIGVINNMHSHMKSKSACNTVINNVIHCKIPKNVQNYYLISLQRLSTNQNYINKIQELIDIRYEKGKKQNFYNSRIKSKK